MSLKSTSFFLLIFMCHLALSQKSANIENPELYIQANRKSGVTCFSFSTDNNFFVICSQQGVSLWDRVSGVELRTFPTIAEKAAISPDNKYVVTGGDLLQVWDMSTGIELMSSEAHQYTISAVSFSPDGKYVGSGAGEELKLWDIEFKKEIRSFFGH